MIDRSFRNALCDLIRNGRLATSTNPPSPSSSCCTVAVKMVKEGHTDADILDLVKEAEIMKVRIGVPDPYP
jgi:hypothetical protein